MRDTTGCGGDAGKLELAEEVVVFGARTLTLVDLDEDTGLVVGVSREDLRLLGRDGSVTLDEGGHDTTSRLNTKANSSAVVSARKAQFKDLPERQGSNIEEKQVLGLLRSITGEDGSLDGGTVGDSLVGVDALVGLLAVEEVRDELHDTGDTSGATDEDDLVDVGLVDLGVAEDLLDGLEGGAEEILAELLETGTGEGGVEVDALEQGVDLDGGLGGGRKGALGTLASGPQATEGTGVRGQV